VWTVTSSPSTASIPANCWLRDVVKAQPMVGIGAARLAVYCRSVRSPGNDIAKTICRKDAGVEAAHPLALLEVEGLRIRVTRARVADDLLRGCGQEEIREDAESEEQRKPHR